MKTKALRDLENQHIGIGTAVKVDAPEDIGLSKFNGQRGEIKKFDCDYNPIPTIQLESGKKIAIELKHLIYPKQSSLF